MSAIPEEVAAGQVIYTRRVLSVYDLLVLGLSSRLIWRCPSSRLEGHYNKHITANHLDVGVGTGYFLDRSRFSTSSPRIALMDLNQSTLDFASRRLARYNPETYRRNVLQAISIETGKFDSVGMSLILHCLPGSIASKAVVFDHVKDLMNPNAVLFGATLLHGGVSRSWFARLMMDVYNKKGIFSNQQDDLEGLRHELGKRFRDVTVEVVGCAVLFSARI